MSDERPSLDTLIDRFDQLWRSSDKPDYQTFLAQASEADRPALLAKLLAIEIEYRIRNSESVNVTDYDLLGESARQLVDQLIAAHAGDSVRPSVSPSLLSVESQVGDTIGPYQLMEKIGEGGMGSVWKAEQEKPVRRRVAVKLIKAGIDNRQVLARFESERQALAMMSHENIARILDAGTTDAGQPYFVMELVQGIHFNRYCDENQLSINDRLKLFIPVCKAVQHAHQKGIIHRDLKPSNVLVCLHDGAPVPKVIDFGLAKALQHQAKLTDKTMFTELGQVVGTLQYMSPEQAEMNQLDIDTRTDVYSLGVMLYESMAGSTPIESDSLRQNAIFRVLESIREKEPPRPSFRLSSSAHEAVTNISKLRQISSSKLRDILQGDLDWIVMKAIEKNRSRRYETANDFAEDIGRFLDGDIVEARPPSFGYRFSKFFAKNKGLVAAVGTIAALLVAAVGVSSWFALDANKARRLAEAKTEEVVIERDRANEKEEVAVAEAQRADSLGQQALEAEAVAKARLLQAQRRIYSDQISRVGRDYQVSPKRALDWLKDAEACPEHLREFTWNYFDQHLQQPITAVLTGHEAMAGAVDYSPDGKRVASAGFDNSVRVWDSKTGESIHVLSQHLGPVTSVRFSPDGTLIASSSHDATVKIWNAATGELVDSWEENEEGIGAVAFSPDGKFLAAASSDKTVVIWNVENGKKVTTLAGHQSWVLGVEFSPDGRTLASASRDRTVRLWDVNTWTTRKVLPHGGGAFFVAFSPDGESLAVTGWAQLVYVWDLTTEKLKWKIPQGNGYPTKCFFSPDGKTLATANTDRTVTFWNASSGQREKTFSAHDGAVRAIAYSPDGKSIVTASSDKSLKIWPITQQAASYNFPNRIQRQSARYDFSAVGGHYFPNGQSIAKIHQGFAAIEICNAKTGWVTRTLRGHAKEVRNFAISPDGKLLVSSDCSEIRIWNLETGETLDSLRYKLEPRVWQRPLAFSPDGRLIAFSGGGIHVYDIEKELETKAIKMGDESDFSIQIIDLAFSADGTELAYCGTFDEDVPVYSVAIWDFDKTGKRRMLRGHQSRAFDVVYSPDGKTLLTGAEDITSRLWDAETGQLLETLVGHKSVVRCVCFSPDGRTIATAGSGGRIRLWDPYTGENWATLGEEAKTGVEIRSLSFSPDGRTLASTSNDGTTRLWESDRASAGTINQRQTVAVVLRLIEQANSKSELSERISAHQDLSSTQKSVAKTMVDLGWEAYNPRKHEAKMKATQINLVIWEKVRTANVKINGSELKSIRDLVAAKPLGIYYNTLSVAEFRCKNFEQAIDAAHKSIELMPAQQGLPGPHAIDLAIMAMCHLELGEERLAEEYRVKFEEAMKLQSFENDEKCLSFAKEMKELFTKKNRNSEDSENATEETGSEKGNLQSVSPRELRGLWLQVSDCKRRSKIAATALENGVLKVWPVVQLEEKPTRSVAKNVRDSESVAKEPLVSFSGQTGEPTALEFFPDSNLLAVACGKTIRLLDIQRERAGAYFIAHARRHEGDGDEKYGSTLMALQDDGRVVYFRTDPKHCNWQPSID